MYGPILLVALADGEVTLQGAQMKPWQWIQMEDCGSLTFREARHTGAVAGQTFRPFYLLRDEHYTTYCRIEPWELNLPGK